MHDNQRRDYSSILARLSTITLYMVMGTGIAAIAAGYFIITSGSHSAIENKYMRNVLFIVCLCELAVAQILKRSMIGKIDLTGGSDEVIYKKLFQPALVIASICSAISIYGLIAVILGSPLEVLLVFIAVSLIGFQLFRIRERDLLKK